MLKPSKRDVCRVQPRLDPASSFLGYTLPHVVFWKRLDQRQELVPQ
jgi:hypothetical protein